MAFPIAPLLNAGSNLLDTGLNALFQGGANRKSRQYATEMYERQRRDALADWNMQNEYNSPMSQMARLRDAGLNPNLVYGHGSAQSPAGVPRGVNADSWRPTAPTVNTGSALSAYYDIQLKEAQIDNMKATNTVLQQDAIMKTFQAMKEGTELRMTEGSDPNNLYESLKQTQLSVAKSMLDKTRAETSTLLDRNEREALTNVQSLREGVERIATMRLGRKLTDQQIQSLDKDNQLKQLDIDLRRQYNIGPNDPLYIRLLTLFLSKLGVNL